MSEYLTVIGRGPTREAALKSADEAAEQYFGDDVAVIRTIGRVEAARRLMKDGSVCEWAVDVQYRPDTPNT